MTAMNKNAIARLRCIRCGARAVMLGVFVPDAFEHRFIYAVCDRCFPLSRTALLEIERRFFADPALASYVPSEGRA